jgi:TatD DNase family protein
MSSLINIHSHRKGGENEITIRNIHQQFTQPLPEGYFSAGIHPCYIDKKNIHIQLQELSTLLQIPSIIAVGECGLDRLCETDFSLQEEIFSAQIQLANAINKPLIIHCVRAFEEVRTLLKKYQCKVPVIWHGFSKKSIQLAEELLKEGAFLSFGISLYKETMEELFKSIPDDRFFLETDNDNITIRSVYEEAARIKKYSIQEIENIVRMNTKNIFDIINH